MHSLRQINLKVALLNTVTKILDKRQSAIEVCKVKPRDVVAWGKVIPMFKKNRLDEIIAKKPNSNIMMEWNIGKAVKKYYTTGSDEAKLSCRAN